MNFKLFFFSTDKVDVLNEGPGLVLVSMKLKGTRRHVRAECKPGTDNKTEFGKYCDPCRDSKYRFRTLASNQYYTNRELESPKEKGLLFCLHFLLNSGIS